jgi:lactoylglutathione lyase
VVQGCQKGPEISLKRNQGTRSPERWGRDPEPLNPPERGTRGCTAATRLPEPAAEASCRGAGQVPRRAADGHDRVVRLRIELFVDDLDITIAFYTGMLGFRVERRAGGYASLRRGHVVLGFGLSSDLCAHDDRGPGSAWRGSSRVNGAGVEIVLELDDPADVSGLYEHCRSRSSAVEPLRLQPWGLHDFRLYDPDGYYVRVTHGDAAAADDR